MNRTMRVAWLSQIQINITLVFIFFYFKKDGFRETFLNIIPLDTDFEDTIVNLLYMKSCNINNAMLH